MRILCVTDIHGDRTSLANILDRVNDIQLTVIGGDITDFGTPRDAEQLVRIAQEHSEPVVAVAGNCDSPEIDQQLVEMGVSVFGRAQIHEGTGVYGVSAMPPWQGTMYELAEKEILNALETGRSQLTGDCTEILVSHAPPRDTSVDLTRRGSHVGSTALRAFIERYQPSLVVSGHIHEACGRDSIGTTSIVNCGPAFLGRYALVEIDEGVHIQLRKA
jgi:Icc-related predicted phosphoesterase